MTLKWGIAGAGLISHDFATAVGTLSSKKHQLIAVGAKDFDRARKFAVLHEMKMAYDSYELLAKDENIDIVYVGVANNQHFEVAMTMLENGKHVLCEKPLCMTHDEASKLIDFARSKNLFLLEGMWSRFFPAYEALDKHVSSGSLGSVYLVKAEFGVPTDEKERSLMKDLGGGVILDLGVYVLQLAQLIYKEDPVSIVCGGYLNDDGVDESMSCILTYSDGKMATLSTHSRVLLENDAVVHGSDGSVKLKTFWAPTIFQTSAADITEWDLPLGKHRFNFYNSAGLVYMAEECRNCLKQDLIESPKMTHSESLSLAKIMDELRRQLNTPAPEDSTPTS